MSEPKFPTTIDETNFDEFESVVSLETLSVRTGENDPIAAGTMHFVQPNDMTAILVMEITGVRPFETTMEAEPGLVLELRLAGETTSIKCGADSTEYIDKAGDLILRGSRDKTRWHVHGTQQSLLRSVNIRFHKEYFRGLMSRAPSLSIWGLQTINSELNRTFCISPVLHVYAQRMFELAKTKSGENDLLIEAISMQILHMIWKTAKVEAGTTQNGKAISIAAYASDMIDSHPTVKLSIRDVSKACRVSETNLKKQFQAKYGVSIGRYMRTKRMERAAEMLQGDSVISEVATILGYSSPEAFARAFRQHFGCSPSAFQN
ncbi:MAG: AraC family transcriptional regulator [Pseudomonadota bacterium]